MDVREQKLCSWFFKNDSISDFLLREYDFGDKDIDYFITYGILEKKENDIYILISGDLFYRYGRLMVKNKNYSSAFICFKKCFDLEPSHINNCFQLLFNAIKESDIDLIEKVLDSLYVVSDSDLREILNLFLYLLKLSMKCPLKYVYMVNNMFNKDDFALNVLSDSNAGKVVKMILNEDFEGASVWAKKLKCASDDEFVIQNVLVALLHRKLVVVDIELLEKTLNDDSINDFLVLLEVFLRQNGRKSDFSFISRLASLCTLDYHLSGDSVTEPYRIVVDELRCIESDTEYNSAVLFEDILFRFELYMGRNQYESASICLTILEDFCDDGNSVLLDSLKERLNVACKLGESAISDDICYEDVLIKRIETIIERGEKVHLMSAKVFKSFELFVSVFSKYEDCKFKNIKYFHFGSGDNEIVVIRVTDSKYDGIDIDNSLREIRDSYQKEDYKKCYSIILELLACSKFDFESLSDARELFAMLANSFWGCVKKRKPRFQIRKYFIIATEINRILDDGHPEYNFASLISKITASIERQTFNKKNNNLIREAIRIKHRICGTRDNITDSSNQTLEDGNDDFDFFGQNDEEQKILKELEDELYTSIENGLSINELGSSDEKSILIRLIRVRDQYIVGRFVTGDALLKEARNEIKKRGCCSDLVNRFLNDLLKNKFNYRANASVFSIKKDCA